MKEEGLGERGVEGVRDARWVLQDFGDVVVHLFHEAHREFYDLEGLWADARQVRWTARKPRA
jgi:ribosome-associated protein